MLQEPATGTTDRRRRARRRSERGEAAVNPWLRWRMPDEEQPELLTVAELAECRCPGLCNRDHVNE